MKELRNIVTEWEIRVSPEVSVVERKDTIASRQFIHSRSIARAVMSGTNSFEYRL